MENCPSTTELHLVLESMLISVHKDDFNLEHVLSKIKLLLVKLLTILLFWKGWWAKLRIIYAETKTAKVSDEDDTKEDVIKK